MTNDTTLTAREVADLIGGRAEGDPGVELSGLAPINEAGPGSLGFLAHRRYLKFLPDTRAGTLLVSEALSGEAEDHPSRVVVEDAHAAMATLLDVFHPVYDIPPGIHATAVISPSATLGEEITVGPYAVLEDDVVVGDRVRILSHCCVGRAAPLEALGLDFGDGVLRLPSQLIEAAVLFGLFALFHFLHRTDRFPGRRLFLYMGAYGLVRVGLELLRAPVASVHLGLGFYQWLALALVGFAAVQVARRTPRAGASLKEG